MKIFNTLTRSKDELVPITEGEVKIYACGPTVYNYIHIGNARPLCVFDGVVLPEESAYRKYRELLRVIDGMVTPTSVTTVADFHSKLDPYALEAPEAPLMEM